MSKNAPHHNKRLAAFLLQHKHFFTDMQTIADSDLFASFIVMIMAGKFSIASATSSGLGHVTDFNIYFIVSDRVR